MIRIDNRFFVPFVVGAGVILFFRVMAWFAGIAWSEELGVFSVVMASVVASVAMAALFAGEISLGHTTIGRRKE